MIKSATISRRSSGKYYVSLLCKEEVVEFPKTNSAIGIDLGITHFAIFSDVSWSSFVAKLPYKADWYGREIIKIDKWFPSSQICSDCGHDDGKKNLKIREWSCPICHAHRDRDINESINILTEGL